MVEDRGKNRRLRWTWKKLVEEESIKFGLIRDDALCRSKWIVDINVGLPLG